MGMIPSNETTNAQEARQEASAEQESEIERLRERLAFYESFDRLIQENIARSGDLLREAMDLRESAARELAEARAEAARLRTTQQARLRETLNAILDDLSTLQGQAERVARRAADALDEVEASLPPGPEPARPITPRGLPQTAPLPPLPPDLRPFSPAEFLSPGEQYQDVLSELPEPPSAAEPLAGTAPLVNDVLETVEVATSSQVTEPTEAPPSSPVVDDAVLAEIAPPEHSEESDQGASTPPEPGTAPDNAAVPESHEQAAPSAVAVSPATRTRTTTLLVHGVPRATTALSLKRYLEGLSHVHEVEPREFAEGILRLQITGLRPLDIGDLSGWPEGQGLEAIHVREDLLEVRLAR